MLITVTDSARQKIRGLLDQREDPGLGLYLAVAGRGPEGFQYQFRLLHRDRVTPGDVTVDTGDFLLFVDRASTTRLEGSTLDFSGLAGGSFKIDNPNPLWGDPLALAVQDVIDTRINPGIAAHGGYITLLGVHEHTAEVELHGGCQGCGAANVTLKYGIERMIRQAVPEIHEVVDITDHAGGETPFYRQGAGGTSPLA